ncbi:RNA polymerase sigma-70 factor (ECF subfamily) [Streptosporangium album]|uniref:RNA polymerase sigma-70 factor (ECF subfamily) n=1 Tax=Streptosporangium album TaxID=47479 RepID=A0A7W7RV72_9ACTN|nr:sigma-70 family RNA polymerase sigma factor [Streptosporangium album]MBB4938747.1 RNA polymerase sigma-70 factor (ECF subfamily) [Streptosporangium album]
MEPLPGGGLPPDDVVVAALRAGDETMFAALLDTWSRGMLWLARSHVSTNDSAEEIVQDTWLAVIRGIDGFEGRSSVKTWVYRILVNTAKKQGVRENRTVPWSSVFEQERPTVDRSRFQGAGDPLPGHWKELPAAWPTPEGEVLAAEVRGRIAAALAELPPRQRAVITLRDVEGCTSEEVCEIMEISAANQRVLLHRARASVRGRLEEYFETARRSA